MEEMNIASDVGLHQLSHDGVHLIRFVGAVVYKHLVLGTADSQDSDVGLGIKTYNFPIASKESKEET